ncbi:MAG: caspase family protein [Acidobacteria bacterium]|nr:caspase family protein [Acidobacteriota bacterium]
MENYAFLVGVSEYLDPNIANLNHSCHAITQLADSLLEHGGFKKANIKIFRKEAESMDLLEYPLKYSIVSSLKRLGGSWNIREDDFFLFYFIGHGFGSKDGDEILMMDTYFDLLEETAISIAFLTQLIRENRAGRKLMVFDSCRNEVDGRLGLCDGLGVKPVREFTTLYACRPREQAYIPRGEELPLLTNGFIRAVKDRDCISVQDMFTTITDFVDDKAKDINVTQHPEIVSIDRDIREIGFLSREITVKTSRSFAEAVRSVNAKLNELYETVYPKRAESYQPFMNAASPLREWRQMIDYNEFRALAFEMLTRGKNGDLYTVSYLLRWIPDRVLFEPLVDAVSRTKYRGTVSWQVLDAIHAIIGDGEMTERIRREEKLRKKVITLLRKEAEEHPTRKGSLFISTVVWGKIYQICKRLELKPSDIFPQEALNRLEQSQTTV